MRNEKIVRILRKTIQVMGIFALGIVLLTDVFTVLGNEAVGRAVATKVEEKEDKVEKKKKRVKKKKKVKKKKQRKNRKAKRKNHKKKNSKKKKHKKRKNIKKKKQKKNKRLQEEKEDKMKLKFEEDVEDFPRTDELKPEQGKEKEEIKEQENLDYYPPSEPQTSDVYTIFGEFTDTDGSLIFEKGKEVILPEKVLIGYRENGENTGNEVEVAWSGNSVRAVKSGIEGRYILSINTVGEAIIGKKNLGILQFNVEVIVK